VPADPTPPRLRPGPRATLLACLALGVAAIATPPTAFPWLAAQALLLAFGLGLAGVPAAALLARWLRFLPLVLLLSGTLALTMRLAPGESRPAVASGLLARNGLALAAALVPGLLHPAEALVAALARLGLPATLAATLYFMHRYAAVLADERDRMLTARRARSFRPARWGPLGEWAPLGGLLGSLFVRALERGERVHDAMLARGWNGDLRDLVAPEAPPNP
jgi:cobalt/nickel transport system permease protein